MEALGTCETPSFEQRICSRRHRLDRLNGKMSHLDVLLKYFPTGTAEGERSVLEQAFIMPEQMADIISAPVGSPRLMVGSKGIGKSAILQQLLRSCGEAQIPAMLLHPDDIDVETVGDAKDIGTLKRRMYQCLLTAMAVRLGQGANGLVSGAAAELHKLAVGVGKKKKDFVERLLSGLNAIAVPVAGVDAEKFARSLAGGVSGPLSEAVKGYLVNAQSIAVLMVDDTDQLAAPTEVSHLNRLWAFLLAVRRLSEENPAIHPIISLRSEVWLRLQHEERGQRDQVDHFRTLAVDLRASGSHLEKILTRRLECARHEAGDRSANPLGPFFEKGDMALPQSTERRPWSSFITKSARDRPRDVVQLVHRMATTARNRGRSCITSADAEESMHTYSRERVGDLSIEVGNDCPQFEDVARTFAGQSFELSFEELRKHMTKIPTRFSVQVRSRTLHADDKDDFVRLLGVLFEAGFINARIPDSRMSKNFRHVVFPDDPTLVSLSRWNDLQAARWEIHPAFRTWLMDVQLESKYRG